MLILFFWRGLPVKADGEMLEEYAKYCIKTYQNEHANADTETQREYYLDDFDEFSENDFSGSMYKKNIE